MAYKAEHVIDLDTEVIIATEIYHADEGDHSTIVKSIEAAQQNLVDVDVVEDIEKVVADKVLSPVENGGGDRSEAGLGNLNRLASAHSSI